MPCILRKKQRQKGLLQRLHNSNKCIHAYHKRQEEGLKGEGLGGGWKGEALEGERGGGGGHPQHINNAEEIKHTYMKAVDLHPLF